MVQLVNGYACQNSADAALARRGIDPATQKRPTAPTASAAPAPLAAGQFSPSQSSPGPSSPSPFSPGPQPGGTGAQPGAAAARGQILDLIA